MEFEDIYYELDKEIERNSNIDELREAEDEFYFLINKLRNKIAYAESNN